MQELADNDLLREYVEHKSEAAFTALVARHVNRVYSVALRHTRNPQQAEEITQAVFVILAQKSSRLGNKVILGGWLYQTARLTALTLIRSEIRRAHREQEAIMPPGSNDREPDLWKQIAPLLDTAMAGLNEKDRHAVVLRYFYDKSTKEIGDALGGSEGAARLRLHRAMEKLRRFFLKRGIDSTTTAIAGALSAHSVQIAPITLMARISAAAIANGAATTSTLTLVKGALNVMAWTKAKSAALAVILIFLTTGVSVAVLRAIHLARVAGYPSLQGAWEGVMLLESAGVAPGDSAASSHVVLKLAKTTQGYTAATDWIEMGRKDVPMGRVVYEYPSLRIERGPNDIWNLKVNGDATQMVLDHSRHFIQPAPVLLLRTATPDPVPGRLEESDFSPRPDSELQGYWKGVFVEETNAIPVNIKIAEVSAGVYRLESDSPQFGSYGEPGTLSYQRPEIKFTDAPGHGLFQGSLRSNATEIIGSWTTHGETAPAFLKRADYAAEHALDASRDYTFRSQSDLQGHWKGAWVVTIGQSKASIRMALDIARMPDGSYYTTGSRIDILGNGGPVPASDFQFDQSSVRIEWKWMGWAYEGSLQNGKLRGRWMQGGGAFPLVFERA